MPPHCSFTKGWVNRDCTCNAQLDSPFLYHKVEETKKESKENKYSKLKAQKFKKSRYEELMEKKNIKQFEEENQLKMAAELDKIRVNQF